MTLLLSALSYLCYYVLKYEMFSKLGYPHEVVRLYTQIDHQLKYQLKYRNFNFPKVKSSSGRLLPREHSLSCPFSCGLREGAPAQFSENRIIWGKCLRSCGFWEHILGWVRPVSFVQEHKRGHCPELERSKLWVKSENAHPKQKKIHKQTNK